MGSGSPVNITNCYSTANVSGNVIGGGLIGRAGNYTTITDSYAQGAVSGGSNVGGLVYLTQLLRPIRDRRIVVVGERDRKPDGRHPGKEGATRTWDKLRHRLGRRVEWRMPPGKAKDMRAWVQGLDLDVNDTDAAFEIGMKVYQ